MLFMKADDVAKTYGIHRSVVYKRIKNHTYRVNEYNEVLIADVIKVMEQGVKKGRPVGVVDKRPRKKKEIE